jgi:antitoxin HicB
MLAYRIKFVPDDNGTLLVTCPALPEVSTFGNDRIDAAAHAADAIEEAIAARIARGEDIPAGQQRGQLARLPALTALKVELYRQLRGSGMNRTELAKRLGWKRESVDRLFRLDHASKLDQIEAAFRAFGRSVDVSIGKAA